MRFANERGKVFRRGKIFLLIITVTILLLIYVTEQLSIITLEKKVLELRKDRVQLETQLTSLGIEAAQLRRGVRIKMIAQDRLGMTVPEGAPEKLF